MAHPSGVAIIGRDTVIEGEIRRARTIEVHGQVKGKVDSDSLIVHPGGHVYGTIRVGAADVNGSLEGDIAVRALISIGASGMVRGKVKYGQIAMTSGAELEADMRNVPPELGGDFEITVKRGQHVRLTTADLTAYDPDSAAEQLTFTVSRVVAGHVAQTLAPSTPVQTFGQVDLTAGRLLFVHDGSSAKSASFDVTVADQAGGKSATRTVTAAVVG